VALQTLSRYRTKNGNGIFLIETGTHSAADMFKAAQDGNNALTWILRVVGYMMMAIGLGMLFQPLVILSNILPFLGNIVGGGVMIFSGLIALVLSITTIAIAWIFYRPILGIILLSAAATALYLYFQAKSKRQASLG
jgi:hypothetical protein